jgi:hypothetical protein
LRFEVIAIHDRQYDVVSRRSVIVMEVRGSQFPAQQRRDS